MSTDKDKKQVKQSIWVSAGDDQVIEIIDQRYLPHEVVIEQLKSWEDAEKAIREMHVRGAPLIGVTAAYGMYLAAIKAADEKEGISFFNMVAQKLKSSRPTAINLAWAVNRQIQLLKKSSNPEKRVKNTLELAQIISNEEIENCYKIGQHGLSLLKTIAARKPGQVLNILTHCNAGWLACVQHGTATAPIYAAHQAGIPVHVWVDETRPRNQGARLTAWELGQAGINHTIIADNTGGHLMQHGMVDCCIVGSDRTTRTGDVANKIGTYLKALAARDNKIPFYVALPGSTFDWTIRDGIQEIPIEKRNGNEIKYIQGLHNETIIKVLISPPDSPVVNYGFDVTPASLVTRLITERGICKADETAIHKLFPEYQDY